MQNIILKTDSYKLNHWNQYPRGTEKVYSYFECRQGATFPFTQFFGLQAIMLKNLIGNVVSMKDVKEAAALCKAHFGSENCFNREGWEYIVRSCSGRLPLQIKAVPEGMCVPTNNVLMTVENTDDRAFWLTNQMESLLTHVWYPSTVATLSRGVKLMIKKYLMQTADNMGGLDFMLHDFGYRGVSSDESAEIGGAAHLTNFLGTDTVPAILFLAEYYSDDIESFNNIAYSVPATEHSVMTARGKDGEKQVVEELLHNYPTGILSVVADSYDIYNFVNYIVGTALKQEVLARDGVLVIRPDSVTPNHPTPESEMVWILDCLWGRFGGHVNQKGYRVLNPKVRVLWGDGIDMVGIQKILIAITSAGFSAENVATFGMGGGLLQKINRDTQRFAFKSSWQQRDGIGFNIFKQPKDVSKTSKKGRLKLVRLNGSHADVLTTVPESDSREDQLKTVFFNGEVVRQYALDEIRVNAENSSTIYASL